MKLKLFKVLIHFISISLFIGCSSYGGNIGQIKIYDLIEFNTSNTIIKLENISDPDFMGYTFFELFRFDSPSLEETMRFLKDPQAFFRVNFYIQFEFDFTMQGI